MQVTRPWYCRTAHGTVHRSTGLDGTPLYRVEEGLCTCTPPPPPVLSPPPSATTCAFNEPLRFPTYNPPIYAQAEPSAATAAEVTIGMNEGQQSEGLHGASLVFSDGLAPATTRATPNWMDAFLRIIEGTPSTLPTAAPLLLHTASCAHKDLHHDFALAGIHVCPYCSTDLKAMLTSATETMTTSAEAAAATPLTSSSATQAFGVGRVADAAPAGDPSGVQNTLPVPTSPPPPPPAVPAMGVPTPPLQACKTQSSSPPAVALVLPSSTPGMATESPPMPVSQPLPAPTAPPPLVPPLSATPTPIVVPPPPLPHCPLPLPTPPGSSPLMSAAPMPSTPQTLHYPFLPASQGVPDMYKLTQADLATADAIVDHLLRNAQAHDGKVKSPCGIPGCSLCAATVPNASAAPVGSGATVAAATAASCDGRPSTTIIHHHYY